VAIDVKSPCRGALALPRRVSMLTLLTTEAAGRSGHSRNRSRRPMAALDGYALNAQAIGTAAEWEGANWTPARSVTRLLFLGPLNPHVPGEVTAGDGANIERHFQPDVSQRGPRSPAFSV